MNLETIALAGGLYVPLVFWHFIADWLTQTENAAQAKSHNMLILFIHCSIYTMLFLPVLVIFGMSWGDVWIASGVLFGSHFIGDTYLPVYWWAKYLRRMTFATRDGTRHPVKGPGDVFGNGQSLQVGDFFKPPMLLVIDQLWHLAFLWIIPILLLYGRG